MTRLWVRCSSTASRPAASASTLLPVPAWPPRLTMPTVGSASRSMAMRCSAERPAHVEQRAVAAHEVDALVGVHPAERRLRARRAARRRCCTAGRGPRRGRRRACVEQLVDRRRPRRRARRSRSSWCRWPARCGTRRRRGRRCDAFSRSGRSLVTTVTSRPSAARLRATARMRWSLLSALSAAGRPAVSLVVELDPQRAARAR